ncbi:MAG: hypothetical protein M1438_19560 [Deltaproteobacteria bacterium]|nr:hypothetical protein [Deltaproteobacteria bacterium]
MLCRIFTVLAILILALSGPAAAAVGKLTYKISQVTNDPVNHLNPSINDLGQVGWCVAKGPIYESYSTVLQKQVLNLSACVAAAGFNLKDMVWTQIVDGYSQVFSSRRGQVTKGAANHLDPAVNAAGEIVWVQMVQGKTQIFSNLKGQVTKDPVNHVQPAINSNAEIVWVQPVDVHDQIFSSRRGQLTFALKDHEQPAINDAGEVVWIEKISDSWQVVSSIHGPITLDIVDHFQPHINNVGAVVWSQKVGRYSQIFKAVPELW